MKTTSTGTTGHLVGLYKSLFVNRADYLAEQKPWGQYKKTRANHSIEVNLNDHLFGKRTYATYSQSFDGKAKWICFDIDIKMGQTPAVGALDKTKNDLFHHLLSKGVPEKAIMGEFSGRRGFHLWIFLSAAKDIETVQGAVQFLTSDFAPPPDGIAIEHFPKAKGNLKNKKFGSCVKLPCGIHRKNEQWSRFEDLGGAKLDPLKALESVVPWSLPDAMLAHRKEMPIHKSKSIRCATTPLPVLEKPELTPELEQLRKGCAFIADFERNPESFNRESWTHAGLVLGSRKKGREWFNWISSKDGRYDAFQVQEIFTRLDEGFTVPLCKTIGCDQCQCKCPLETIGVNEHYRHVAVDEIKQETVSLGTVRQEMKRQLESLIDAPKTSIFLVNAPLGTGKTKCLSKLLMEKNKKTLWFCPTYALSSELPSAHVIEGWEKLSERNLICSRAEKIKKAIELGIFGDDLYCSAGECERCDFYKAQFDCADKAFVVLMHAHVTLSKTRLASLCSNREIVVFDENFLSSYCREIRVNVEELEALRSILCEVNGNEIISTWLDPCLNVLKDSKGQSVSLPSLKIPDEIESHVAENFLKRAEKNVLPALKSMAGKSLNANSLRDNKGKYLWFDVSSHLPNLPTFILDSTGRPSDYSKIIGKPVFEVNPLGNRRLTQFGKVYQAVSGMYPESSIIHGGKFTETGERLKKFIQERMRGNIGIISTKKCIALLKQKFPDAKTAHFHNLRGINDFELVDQLYIVGCQCLNYWDLAAQARIMFGEGWDDATKVKEMESSEKQWQGLSYEQGGVGIEIKTFVPAEKSLNAVHHMKVIAEVEQAIGRARISTDQRKEREIFILTNLPIKCVRVDEMVNFEDTLPKSYEAMRAAAQSLLDSKGMFTKEELMAAANVSERTYFEHIGSIEAVLGLRKSKAGRKDLFQCDMEAPSNAQNEPDESGDAEAISVAA